ncbi:MAG: cyclase family protein, partial [Desulfofustis sp.]|nr:cyclase family protein [Desulfofustis sp.]
DGDGYREMIVTLCTHQGTHLDAPAHLLADGLTLDRLALTSFVGKALLLDCTTMTGTTIDEGALHPYGELLGRHDFVLLHTGWSRWWGEQRYFRDYPVLSEAAARRLVAAGVRGVGVDAVSVDPLAALELPIHRLLLGAGLVIVENLTNLATIPQQSFLFSCLPLNIENGDGSPVRAVALLPGSLPLRCQGKTTTRESGR